MTRRTASYVTTAAHEQRAAIAVGARAIREQVADAPILCRCAVSQTSVRSTGTLRCEKCGRPVST